MLILRDPDLTSSMADPDLRSLVDQRFQDIAFEEPYDPDLNGYMIIVEPGDSVEALESETGCPILRSYIGDARYGDPGFKPVFECLEERETCYEMVFVPGDGDFGIVLFIPKQEGIDADLLAMCAEYAEPAP